MLYYATRRHPRRHTTYSKEWADRVPRWVRGWDVYRQKTFEQQKRLRIVHPTPGTRQPDLFPRGTVCRRRKRLFARQMEVFAGFSENADWNVGRLLDAIEDLGESDNTWLVFYIWRRQHGGHQHRFVQ